MIPTYLIPLFTVLLLLPYSFTPLFGQGSWKDYKHEFSIGAGTANCLTDLGGGKGDGGYVKDIDFNMTRPAVQAGYRLRAGKRIAFKSTFSYMRLGADDANSKNSGRRKRNLSFFTNLYELNLQFEYYIIREPMGKLNLPGFRYRGPRKFDYTVYLFGGIAPFYFNPKTRLNGSVYSLRPLSTEGQGLPGGPDPYGRIAVSFPLGAGFKYIINRQMNIGFEIAVRFTTTDYLDDVSTTYYPNSIIKEEHGSIAAQLADRRTGNSRGKTGSIRGNPDRNDAYFTAFFTFNYKLAYDQRIKILFWRK